MTQALAASFWLVFSAAAAGADSYDAATRRLTLPVLEIGNSVFTDVVVTIGQVLHGPSGAAALGITDTFDPVTGQLTVQRVAVGASSYFNAVGSVAGLVSVGSLSGADIYTGSELEIAAVQIDGGAVRQGVAVTVGKVIDVAGGMPRASIDQYSSATRQLLIPAVSDAVNGRVYTNVTVQVGTILSAGAVATAGPGGAPAAPAALIAGALASVNGAPSVSLGWQASATSGPVSYLVERCTGVACTDFSAIGATMSTRYLDATAAIGTSYLYRVRAGTAGTGFSALAGPATVTTYTASAAAIPAGQPGLREANGSVHVMPTPNPQGTLINVVQRAAELGVPIDLADSASDDRPGIEAVLRDAKTVPGSTAYFPNGTYNLVTPWSTNANADIVLTTPRVNLLGESQSGTVLKSSFDDGGSLSLGYTGILVSGVQDVVISSLTVMSTWNRAFATSTSGNSTTAGGVTYAIVVQSGGSPAVASTNVVIENVTVERYHRMGIVAGHGSHDIVIRGCLAFDATDIGDGGTGYGFVVEGPGHAVAATNPNLGNPAKDQYFTLIDSNRAHGPNIRHGVLLQYWSHNNLVVGNALDDNRLVAISLHGEDEYANEMANNAITRSYAGIGFGNSGATHANSGPFNWAHDNDLASTVTDGFFVDYGTPESTIASNTVRDSTTATGAGAVLGSSSNSFLLNNLFINNSGAGFIDVKFVEDPVMNASPAGGPLNWVVSGNHVIRSGKPFLDNSHGTASGNQVQTSW